MPRALWKGAISFGLINIPVELFTAEKNDELDFHMLDRRDLAPVGYKRVNKKSGREVPWENIIKGYEYEDGKYVLMSDEDLRRANVEATQSIDIQSFVEVDQVPILYYEQPYYLAPAKGGEKAYALLRETLLASDKMAIAQIVIRTRQHLAALLPGDAMLHLITLRYPTELRPPDDIAVPSRTAKKSGVSKQEVEMARTLVEHMSADWMPEKYRDTYRDDVLALINKKIKSHQTHEVAEPDEQETGRPREGKVVDLMALLKSSLEGRGKAAKSSRETDTNEVREIAKPRAVRGATVHKLPGRKPTAMKAAVSRAKSKPGNSAPAARAATSRGSARRT